MREIGAFRGSWSCWIDDINHDGRYEIGERDSLGCSSSPVWSDIYAYKNGRYVKSNQDFPWAFQPWVDQLRKIHKQDTYYDNCVLPHLGEIYEILHQPRQALATYQEAEKAEGLEADDRQFLRRRIRSLSRQLRLTVHRK
jgi:hypothetical protein